MLTSTSWLGAHILTLYIIILLCHSRQSDFFWLSDHSNRIPKDVTCYSSQDSGNVTNGMWNAKHGSVNIGLITKKMMLCGSLGWTSRLYIKLKIRTWSSAYIFRCVCAMVRSPHLCILICTSYLTKDLSFSQQNPQSSTDISWQCLPN